MNAAAINYTVPESHAFSDTVKRAASLLYARLLRMHNANTNTATWICNRANQLKDMLKDGTEDKRLADMLFVFTACRSKGEEKNSIRQKVQDVANDYTYSLGFEQLSTRSIELMIWRFFVLRELYYMLAKQLRKIEGKTENESFIIKEIVISPYTLQNEFTRLGGYCLQNNPAQLILS
jgi:hypothetical protein